MIKSNLGYKRYSPDKNQKSLLIPSRHITMQDVDIPLRLVPVIKGEPDYTKSVVARPGDKDIVFGDDVESVLEIPLHQIGDMVQGYNGFDSFNSYGYDYNVPNPQMYNMLTGLPAKSIVADPSQNYSGESQGLVGNSTYRLSTQPYRFPNTSEPKSLSEQYGPNLTIGQDSKTQGLVNWKPNDLVADGENLSYLKRGVDAGLKFTAPKNLSEINSVVKEAEKVPTETTVTVEGRGDHWIGGFNPYTGWNMQNAAQAAGRYFTEGRMVPGIAAVGKFAFEGIRNYMSGRANALREREARNEYNARIGRDQSPNNIKKWRFFKEGGVQYMKGGGRVGRLLTGNYIDGGSNDGTHANAELEDGEYFKTPQNETYQVIGKKHSEGGEKLNLEQGTEVVSDYLKIGSKLATYFKKHFDLNVAPSNTFATVVDKFKKKIGLTKLLEEEGEIMKKIYDQENTSHEATKDLNLQVLSDKVNKLQPQKEKLEDMLNNFMDVIFDRQEETKELEGNGYKKQEGGVQEEPSVQEGGRDLGGEEQLVQLIQMYAEMNGIDPQALMQQLQSLPENEFQMAVQQMIETVQSAQQGEQSPAPQEGGQTMEEGDVRMLLQAFAEKSGKSVEEVFQIFSEIPDNEKQVVLEDMRAYVSGEAAEPVPAEEGQPTMQQGGVMGGEDEVTQLINAYSQLSGVSPEELISQLQQLPEDQLQAALEQMSQQITGSSGSEGQQQGFYKEGGRHEVKKYQEGDTVDHRMYTDPSAFLELMAKGEYRPTYQYRDLKGYGPRLRDIFGGLGLKYGTYNTQADYDKAAALFQQTYLDRNPELARHYSQRIDATQQGLQYLLDNKVVDANKLKGYGLKIYNGKVGIGSLGGMNEEGKKYVADAVTKMYADETEAGKKIAEGYTGNNFFDKKFYFRAPRIHNVGFKTEQERDEWLKKQGYELVSDKDGNKVYYSNVRGEYLQPHIGEVKDGKLVKPDGTVVSTDPENPENPDPNEGLKKFGDKDLRYSYDAPRLPVPTDYQPTLMTPSLRHIGHVQADHFAVSPESAVQGIIANSRTTSDLMSQTNPYTSAFGQSDLFAKTNKAIADAHAKSEMLNQQDKRNVDNLNEQRILARDSYNIGATDRYEQLAQTALQGFIQEQQNVKDRFDLIQTNNYNTTNQVMASNAINPFFQITGGGWRMVADPHEFMLRQLGLYKEDPSSNKSATKTTKTTTNADGSKTTTTTKGRKGGTWKNKGFRR